LEHQVAKKGISIKELARELGVTSRRLIDRCREAGIPVQNSITKLDAAAEQKARSLFNEGRASQEGR
jgi:hypothetical protein